MYTRVTHKVYSLLLEGTRRHKARQGMVLLPFPVRLPPARVGLADHVQDVAFLETHPQLSVGGKIGLVNYFAFGNTFYFHCEITIHNQQLKGFENILSLEKYMIEHFNAIK